MADRKISAHTALATTAVATGDLLEVVDISDTTDAGTGTNKKITTLEQAVAFDRLHAPDSLMTRYLKPTGSYETFSRASGLSNQGPLTSGIVSLFSIGLPKDLVVTNITFVSATTTSSATHWWFSLCNSSYVTLRSTADQLTAAWAANTVATVALSSTFTTTYEGLYYLAIMVTGTVPSLMGSSAAPNSVVTAIAPLVAVNGITGQTTAPADGTNLATAPTAKTVDVWAYVT